MTRMETPLFSDDGSTPARPAPSPRVSRWVLALALAALLALCAGNARAQTGRVCSDTPDTGEWVFCEETDGSTDDIDIDIDNLTIEVPVTSNDAAVTGHQNQAGGHVDIGVLDSDLTATADGGAGVLGRIFVGNGDNDEDVDIDVRNTDITTSGTSKTIIGTTFFAHGIHGYHDGSGDLDITVVGGTLTTKGRFSDSVAASHPGDSGDITINVRGATLKTESTDIESDGIEAYIEGAGVIDIDVTGTTIETTGTESEGISTTRGKDEGDTNVDVTGGSRIETAGAMADGIYGLYFRNTTGDLRINVRDSSVSTNSYDARGINGVHSGAGDIVIDVRNSSVAANETEPWPALNQTNSDAIRGLLGRSSDGDVRISVTGGSVTTKGTVSHAIHGQHGNLGDIDINVTDAAVRTESTDLTAYDDTFSMGIYANHTGAGNVDVSVTRGSVGTAGVYSHGILAWHRSTTDPERSIDVTVEGASVTARGAGANAIQVGRAVGGVADRAAAPGADGYRKQTVRVNGPVYGGSGQNTAGVYLGGGGKVYIGPKGSVGAESGIAVLATGSAPRLYLDMDLDGRRLADVIGDDWIINDGGETTIVVNDVTLHDERGVTGLEAPNGAFDVTMRREGVKVTDRATDPWSVSPRAEWTGRDRDFSAGDFVLPTPVVRRVELAPERGSGGEWNAGERVEVRVRFSMPVRVDVPAGGRGPEYVLIFCHEEDERGGCKIGKTSPVLAAYAGGAGTETLTFSYTVDGSQDGAKSVELPHFGLLGRDARIVSAEGDEAVDHKFRHNAVFNLFLRADENRDGLWSAGEKIVIIARFRREVVVSTSGGAPTLGIEIGDGRGSSRARRASYARGGNTDLVFEYPVVAADGVVRAVRVPANSLRRNGGAIRDRRGYDAALGHGEKEWSTILPPLTGRFASQPERHDGKKRVKVEVAFSEAPDNVDERSVRVEGGRVKSVRPVGGNAPGRAGTRSVGGRNAGQEDREVVWEFEIEPDTDGDVTVTLEANRPCEEPGAICTVDGRSLSEGISTTVEGPEAGPPPLTASFLGLPEAHDGESAFRFRVAFSENIGISYRSLREDAFAVTGGRVTRGKRVDGRRDLFEITVEPDGAGDVAISLPAGRECSVSGAICTKGENRRQLTNTPAATVAGPPVETLTASFSGLPAEHDGESGFTFRIAFSERVGWMNGRRLREDVVAVAGGRATSAGRVNRRRDLWRVTVEPDSPADVTVTLSAGAACRTPAAVCTSDGRALSNTISATVRGPVALSVADARAREGADATIDFAVSLSRAASGAVSVAYATADGTASAGSDYTARLGALTFAPGETVKTVSVPVLDDAHDEGAETFMLRLSVASGAVIADGEATGTIINAGSIPEAWLAHFGRAAAEGVLEAVDARIGGGAPARSRLTLGGHEALLEADPAGGFETGDDSPPREVSMKELLLSSSFHMASAQGEGKDATGRWSLWGRGSRSAFSGRDEALSLEGDVTTGVVGADYETERMLVGVALAYSAGEGSYAMNDARGEVESTLLGAYPYLRYRLGERLSLWGVVGLGEGELTLEVEQGGERMEADLSMGMAAFGMKGALLSGAGYDLAWKGDALLVRTESDAAAGLRAARAGTRRLRLALEASREMKTGDAVLTPSVEVGIRYDGGDAERGAGVEVGGGLRWTNSRGLTVEVRARGLLAHEEGGFEEWGVGGSVVLAPGAGGRGLSFRAGSSAGAAASGVERMWSQRPAAGGAFDSDSTLEAEVGYGLDAMGGLLTPYTGLSVSEAGGTYRVGGRFRLGERLTMSLEGERREKENGEEPVHGVALRGSLRW